MPEAIQIPNIYLPFPYEINQHYQKLRQETNKWMVSTGLVSSKRAIKRMFDTDISYLSAAADPTFEYRELLIMDKFIVLVCILDDQLDDSALGYDPIYVEDVLEDLFSTMDEDGTSQRVTEQRNSMAAFKYAYSDWWNDVVPITTRQWRDRFRLTMAEYFESFVDEAKNRNAQRTPGLEEYILLRRNTGVLRPFFLIVELGLGLHNFTYELMNHPVVQQMNDYANDFICWTNDIFSCDKEILKGDVHNLIVAVKNEKGCNDYQEAADIAGEMMSDRVREYIRLRTEELPKITIQEIRQLHPNLSQSKAKTMKRELYKYFDDLKFWFTGHFQWYYETLRYSKEENKKAVCVDYLENILEPESQPVVARAV